MVDQRAGEVKPNPDPTIATNEAVERAMKSERDYVDGKIGALNERFHAMDKATDLRLNIIDEMPARIDEKVARLNAVTDERFSSVASRFTERDTRSERESRDNKVAVDAAFAAQKEAAAKQDEANQKAIDKSEKATNETINKNAEVVQASNKALSDKIDDIKDRIARVEDRASRIESAKTGGTESRFEDRSVASNTRAVIAFGVSLILAAIIIVGVILDAKRS